MSGRARTLHAQVLQQDCAHVKGTDATGSLPELERWIPTKHQIRMHCNLNQSHLLQLLCLVRSLKFSTKHCTSQVMVKWISVTTIPVHKSQDTCRVRNYTILISMVSSRESFEGLSRDKNVF